EKSAQAFLLAQALDGFEVEQWLSIFWSADVSLDADEIVEPDHAGRMAADGDGLRLRRQVVVRADRLQVAEKIQRILAVDFERVILPQRQRLCVQSKLQLGRSAAKGQVQRRQRGREPLEILGRAPIAQVDVVGDACAAHE